MSLMHTHAVMQGLVLWASDWSTKKKTLHPAGLEKAYLGESYPRQHSQGLMVQALGLSPMVEDLRMNNQKSF